MGDHEAKSPYAQDSRPCACHFHFTHKKTLIHTVATGTVESRPDLGGSTFSIGAEGKRKRNANEGEKQHKLHVGDSFHKLHNSVGGRKRADQEMTIYAKKTLKD